MRFGLRARRSLLLVATIAIAAPLALADSPVTAAPGDIDDPGTDPYVPTDPPTDNPVILAGGTSCGVDLAMVFDLSNSVDNTELGQLKSAGDSMVDALVGTDSRISIYNFATFAPASGVAANFPLDLTPVSDATTIKNRINGLTKPASANGGTNWEQGLQQVLDAAGRGSRAAATIFFTDGDPTVHGIPGPSDDHGTSVDQADVNAAIVKANQLKALPSRVIPVGIGDGANGWQQRLASISGIVVGQDYYLVSNFAELTALVQSIAQGLCDATIHVTKMVSKNGVLSPAANWAFAATDTPAAVPPNGLTAADGTLPFTIAFNSNTDPARRVRVTETQQPFHVLQQQAGANATCRTAGGASVPVQNDTALSFSISVLPLQTINCTVINAAPTLTLVKSVINDNGGTATAANFTLSAAGPTPISGAGGVSSVVTPGQYVLNETTVPGYSSSGVWSCVGGITVDARTVFINDGQSATCTIVNNDLPASLTLVKTLINDNGGTALATDFVLDAAGPTPLSGAGGVPKTNVLPGTYALSETNQPGYATLPWDCGGTAMSDATHVVIALDQNITCSITNNDISPTLRLIKTVVNNNGGTAVSTDFIVTASGAGLTTLSGAGGAFGPVLVGTYTLSESTVAGYGGTWNCGGATMPTANQVSIALAQNVTCTITNDDIPATLTLVKTVTNDNGGTALPINFTLTASGAGLTTLSGAGGATGSVLPGTYTLSESNVAGYTAGAWNCGAATMPQPNEVTVALGQTVSCTINNNDTAATLTLVKTVTNNGGGTALPTNFILTASGAGLTTLTGPGGATGNVLPGTYTLGETPLAGYTAGAWNCGAATMPQPNQVSIALGQTVSCAINNDDVSATLALTKAVTNDNGGTAVPTDFTLTAGGVGLTTVTGDGSVSPTNVLPGTYTLSETNVAGYAAGAWSCPGATMPQPDQVTIILGQTVSCTINNNDIAATLTLVKTVTNDNLGSAVPTDFTLTASGTGLTTLTGPGGATGNVLPGTYTLSETTLPGYSAGAWDCGAATMPTTTEVTVVLGQTVSCTIDNNDIAPTWTLAKSSSVADGEIVSAGDSITYTLTATNTGPVATGALTITDDLSQVSNNATVAIPNGEPSLGSASLAPDGLSLTWTIPALPANSSATLHYTAVIDLTATSVTITNSATGDGTPPPATCPTGSIDCTTSNRVRGADLTITKRNRVVGSVDDHNVVVGVGDSFLYDFVVSNVGVGSASGITVTDSIPGNLVVDPASFVVPPNWTVNFQPGPGGAGGLLSFSYPGPLAAGASASMTARVTVQNLPQPDPTQPPGPIINTASVTSQTPDDDPGNNTSTETTPIKAVTLSATPACRNNAPWIDYTVGAFGFTPTTIQLRWWSAAAWNNGSPIGSPSAVTPIPVSPLTGSVIWPGTVLDASGNPTDWPGWTLGADGIWVVSTGQLGDDLRPTTIIQVVANPTVAATEVYPPATPVCDPNPPNSGSGVLPDDGGDLPATGNDFGTTVMLAAALVLLGVGLSSSATRRGRRSRLAARN